MKNILKTGISSNMLKNIAIIAMVIDHIGFYFSASISPAIYIICRAIGRIAMPIFVYLLVQGFFHTKDYKKYVIRMGIFAVITQILVTILMAINIKYIPGYISAKQVYITGNILFSFVIALFVLKLLHEDVLIKKWEYNKNLSLKVIIIATIFILCAFIPLDYDLPVLILSMLMYYLEKFRIKLLIEKSRGNISIRNILLNNLSEEKIKMLYIGILLPILSVLVIYFGASWTTLLAIIPIALYNGDRGKTNLKNIYYILFPLQHALLYSLAMIIALT